jgi:hypothetical protein
MMNFTQSLMFSKINATLEVRSIFDDIEKFGKFGS